MGIRADAADGGSPCRMPIVVTSLRIDEVV